MAFSAITSGAITAGQPTTQELFTKIKDNFDNHESRLLDVESAVNSFLPIEFSVYGPYTLNSAPSTGVLYERLSFNFTALAARILIHTAGPSGTLEVDIKLSRSGGAFATIFSTKPSVVYTAGDLALSTNAVLSTTSFLAGDILRLDITSNQGVGAEGFTAYLEYER